MQNAIFNDPNTPEGTGAHDASSPVYQIGSAHPGIINALLGDGSVRAVSVTTEPMLMWQLGCAFDGASVSLN